MGYAPPGRPIILPAGVTWQTVAAGIGAGILSTNEARELAWPFWRAPGLPRTFVEYRAQLYGAPSRDILPALNAALLAAGLGLVVLIVSVIAR